MARVRDTGGMQKREVLGEAETPGGAKVTLAREGGRFVVAINGLVLMSSEEHGSEEELGRLACAPLAGRRGARVAIGGLGMGYTLRAVLNELAADGSVTVVDFLPPLVEWNRGVLGELAGRPLDDPRTSLALMDFVDWVKTKPGPFDAILMDLDNGPEAFTSPGNEWLYSRAGLQALKAALRPGGVLSVWSVEQSPRFERRLREAGFEVEVTKVRGRPEVRKGSRFVLFSGRLGVAEAPGATGAKPRRRPSG